MRAAVVVLLVTAVHAAMWGMFREKQSAPDVSGILPSVSYTPFEPGHPAGNVAADSERIRADLKKLVSLTRALRLYSSTEGNELVPRIAAEFGLKVTVGAWIDRDQVRNEREIGAAIQLARRNNNVIGVVVGNEIIYRGEQVPIENLGPLPEIGIEPAEAARVLGEEAQRVQEAEAQPEDKKAAATIRAVTQNNVDRLAKLIRRVKKSVNVPVTTGEIWNIWRDYPQLAHSVDFIAAHVLPYWERFSDEGAANQALHVHHMLRDTFPGKRIVIAEFGWPSADYSPRPFRQAAVLRNFVTRADGIGMEYNIVEAIDQPWKAFEGGVGPYWGILDASRKPKFAWTGPVVDENHGKLAILAVLVGMAMSLPILWLTEASAARLLVQSVAANLAGALVAVMVAYWSNHYFIFGSALALTLGLILLIPLALIAMVPKYFAVWIGRALKSPWRHTSC